MIQNIIISWIFMKNNYDKNKIKNNKLYIEDYKELSFLDKTEFEKFFENYTPILMNKIFQNPKDSESNFQNYFKYDFLFLDKPFQIHKNEKTNFINNIVLPNFGKKQIYFGFPGIGKSISIIEALKYSINHEFISTLYINCKYLNQLIEKWNISKIKQILIAEIPFLFYNNYDGYINCCNKIEEYQYNRLKPFWPLMDFILSIIKNNENKNKKFIIAFDQYKQKNDKENN